MKRIHYLIVDDDASGRVKCSLDESTIIAYRISRKHLSNGTDNFDKENWTKKNGIYLLISRGNLEKPPVYIGQADHRKNGDAFIARLSEHLKGNCLKEENKGWYEAILLTVKDDNSIPLDALEHKFWSDANKNGRCTLSQTEPHNEKITDEMRGYFNDFVEYGKIFVGILGHKIFEPLSGQTINMVSSPTKTTTNNELFKYKFKKGTLAYGKRTDEGFVVLKGAKIAATRSSKGNDISEQTKRHYAKIDLSREEKSYAINTSTWETTEDLLFGSAHQAGCFVAFGWTDHINYWIEIETQKSLNDIQKEEAESLAKNEQ